MNRIIILQWLLLSCCLWASPALMAQDTNVTESGNIQKKKPRDNFYNRYLHTERRVLAYDYIHEKDVFWEKRVWRLIDIREKMNHTFSNPKEPFINILLEAASEGDITLYGTFTDDFSEPLTQSEVDAIIYKKDTICTFDPETLEEICLPVVNELNPEDIKQYYLKEVYFFDEETSKMDVRILGIAPIIERYDDNGNFLNSGPMFWVYYPEARQPLARKEAFNTQNDAARMSWEDVFEARFFSSYITKASNVYDRRIKDYCNSPMAILLESDKIKESIFNFEHDLWSY